MEPLSIILFIALAILVGVVVWLASRRATIDASALRDASRNLAELAGERFARQAEATERDLDTKKQLIDQRLEQMSGSLKEMNELVRKVENERGQQFSTLSEQIKALGKQADALTVSTVTLREALSSSKARGQWGERMAEDILRLVGMVEGINYYKQVTLEGSGSRPDFVFLLPGGLRVNMDVKFPLDNYVRYLDSGTDMERDQHRSAFLRDVRQRVKDVAGREYIDPQEGTVDYALLFIPSESVYSFTHEHDTNLLEDALRQNVVCCSPLTLFAVLALMRQAIHSFALQRASEEIVGLFGRFFKEWHKFNESLETLGKRLTSTQRAYDDVMGPRLRQLLHPVNRIEALREQRGIHIASSDEGPAALPPPSNDEEEV